MTETSLDRIISEEKFAALLGTEAELFFRIGNSVEHQSEAGQRRQRFFQLGIEANHLESLLDDHGAKRNQSYGFFRELVASIRGFSRVGFSLEHLQRRFDSYGTLLNELSDRDDQFRGALEAASGFTRDTTNRLLEECRSEAVTLGIRVTDKFFPEDRYTTGLVNLQLPHNLGDERI